MMDGSSEASVGGDLGYEKELLPRKKRVHRQKVREAEVHSVSGRRKLLPRKKRVHRQKVREAEVSMTAVQKTKESSGEGSGSQHDRSTEDQRERIGTRHHLGDTRGRAVSYADDGESRFHC
ncbi:hypothetical protein R1sor_019450 [Riccia sorocarpa]|uniref:Uncharacterized protein n=1 Tax=Riccia sorocarpa TaxID=122646 RepID=A0ABD3ICL0_9MARC